jgi:hypothetical protein
MDSNSLARDLELALGEMPLLDAHTHLDASHLTARGLHDILLYHMVVSDLASAGCPDRERLPEEPTEKEAAARIERALPFLPAIANTSCFWGTRIILADLYGWKKPVTRENWRSLDGIVRDRSGESGRPVEILDKARIVRSCTELWRRRDGRADALFQYSLEWAFFARSQWGEYDTALYELEKAWSEGRPGAPLPIAQGGSRPKTSRTIHSLRDARAAIDAYVEAIPLEVLSTAQHISTDIEFREVDDRTMSAALSRRRKAGPAERDIYASFITEEFFKRLEERRSGLVFQFSLGAEPLPFETASRLSQKTLAQLASMIALHPGIHFQCFLSSAHANQTLCTFARELPNFSLAGYWWHNFFPPFIERVMRERLDMLSTSRQVGFFSDAYTLEWSYAKSLIVRKVMARVLADKVLLGQYSSDDALAIARALLYDSPQSLLGLKPRDAARPSRRSAGAKGAAALKGSARPAAAKSPAKRPSGAASRSKGPRGRR